VRLFLLLVALSSAACFAVNGASPNAAAALRVQASTDFDCPQRDLTLKQGWGGKYAVEGCGQRATYDTSCDGLHCTAAPLGQVVPWASRPDPTPNGASP